MAYLKDENLRNVQKFLLQARHIKERLQVVTSKTEREKLEKKLDRITKLLDTIPDNTSCTALYRYYIIGQPWNIIAQELAYSEPHLWRKHREGLAYLHGKISKHDRL